MYPQVFIPQPPAAKNPVFDTVFSSYVPTGIYSPASGGKNSVFDTFFKNVVIKRS